MKYLFILIFLISPFLPAQDSSAVPGDYYPFRVDTIVIKGNDITDPEIITRELTFRPGDTVSYEQIMFNRERIFSLGIFNRVDLYTSPDSLNILVVDVEESWYIYPLPFAELKDKSWDKISYGLDFIIKNFRGRNELIRFRGALGYDPNLIINYTVPSLTSDGDYYFFTDLVYTRFRNKSTTAYNLIGKNFDQKLFGGGFGFGRRFGVFHRFSMNLSYNYIENPEYVKGISASSSRIDRFPVVGFNYIFDTRDLAQFPTNGTVFNTAINFKGLGLNNIRYQILNVDFREYRKLWGELAGKWRLSSRFAFGKMVPTHDLSYLGFGDRIRGFYSAEMEGHNLYLASAEIYYPLFKELRVNFDWVPLLPKELLHYRAGLYMQVFTDHGTTKFRHSSLSYNNFLSGYGTGLTLLILPYNILRVEFAVSENGTSEWIVDLGISF